MLVLIVLLSCLVSILMMTLLNIVDVNAQLIVFLSTLIVLILFKLVLDKLINKNKSNPVSKNMISNVNVENQSTLDSNSTVVPSNFNMELNTNNGGNVTHEEHPFVNVNVNNMPNNNGAHNNNHNAAANPNNNGAHNNNHNAAANHNNQNAVANNNNHNAAAHNNNHNAAAHHNNHNATAHHNNHNATAHSNNHNVAHNDNTAHTNNVPHACLLENTPCAQVNQLACSNAKNSDPNAACPANSGTNLVNGEEVSHNCATNNDVNYNDVFNVDHPLSQYNEVILPQSATNSNDCAFDNTCVVSPDSGNMHLASQFSPGDPEFSETKDFWKFKANTSDLCYVKRAVPEFYNFDN